MTTQDNQTIDKIKNLSNADLLNMLEQASSIYTPLAWQTALQELSVRGGRELLIQKIEEERARQKQLNLELEQREKERPKVPTGCKVLGWLWIIGSLIVIYQVWNRPGHEAIKITEMAIGLVIAVSAFTMLAGNKIGLAVFSSFLLIAGVGIPVAAYVASKTLPVSGVVMSFLFYLLPAFYLFSKWKVFVKIGAYKNG